MASSHCRAGRVRVRFVRHVITGQQVALVLLARRHLYRRLFIFSALSTVSPFSAPLGAARHSRWTAIRRIDIRHAAVY